MPAPTKKILIAVFAALAGLAAIALTPAAFAKVPPVQAADARAVAADLAALEAIAGPADRETKARTDADPAELNALTADRGKLVRSFTAGTDAPRRRGRRRARRRH